MAGKRKTLHPVGVESIVDPELLKKPKATEADLCRAFIEWAQPEWTAYAETAGWDILLVRVADGLQLGIQAKLNFNATLLRQALPKDPHWCDRNGPDYRGVLLPKWSLDIHEVCEFCGLVYFMPGRGKGHRSDGDGPFSADFIPKLEPNRWVPWPSKSRIKLPDYVPDVAAGASGPRQLTQWKIAALKICAVLEIRGHVTREDFRAAGIDHRRWVPVEWLAIEDGRYVRGKKLKFHKDHPSVYRQILADMKKLLSDAVDYPQ